MGTIDETVHAIVQVLKRSPTPEPLGISLWREPPEAVRAMVLAILDECDASQTNVSEIHISAANGLAHGWPQDVDLSRLRFKNELIDRLEIYRAPPVQA